MCDKPKEASVSSVVAPCKKSEWNLRAQIVSSDEGAVPNGTKVKISIAHQADHYGTTHFAATQVGGDGKSPVEYLLTGYTDKTFYLFADAEGWRSSADESVALAVGDDKTVTVTLRPKQIQCIAYYLYTGYDKNTKYLGIDDPAKFENSEVKAARADMLARCKIMTAAIAEAYDTAKVEKDKENVVVKLFMAPEFYFRGQRGAYPLEVLSEIIPEMRKETDKAKYKDWLFVFGTALGYVKHEVRAVPKTHKLTISASVAGKKGGVDHRGLTVTAIQGSAETPANFFKSINPKSTAKWTVKQNALTAQVSRVEGGALWVLPPEAFATGEADLIEPNLPATEVFNVALVQKGGPDDNTFRQVVIYKEYIAQVDFVKTSAAAWDKEEGREIDIHGEQRRVLPTDGSRDLLGVNPNVSEINTSGAGGGSVFTIGDITYGLEICADHDKRRLFNYYNSVKGANAGEPKVQVHLIPSGGMDIGQPCCVADGLVFNVDHDHIALKETGGSADVKHVTLAAIANAPADLTFTQFFDSTKDISKVTSAAGQMKSAKGYIVVYPPKKVPTKAVVT